MTLHAKPAFKKFQKPSWYHTFLILLKLLIRFSKTLRGKPAFKNFALILAVENLRQCVQLTINCIFLISTRHF